MTAAPASFPEPVYVTRPLLPPLDEYSARLREIWQAQWLTNNGAQHQALTRALAAMLGTPHVSLFANGTLALLAACRTSASKARRSPRRSRFRRRRMTSLGWVTPVFADIDAATLTSTPRPSNRPSRHGLRDLAVHVYGNPCDVEALARHRRAARLKLIYDAAHAFGTMHQRSSIVYVRRRRCFQLSRDEAVSHRRRRRADVGDAATRRACRPAAQFRHANETDVVLPGINGKMSELSAALGLSVLPHLADERYHRARVAAVYDRELASLPGIAPVRPSPASSDSLQYYVIRVDGAAAGCTRDELHVRLKRFNVHTRRYFWPLCSDFQPIARCPPPHRRICLSRTALQVRCCACRCTAP